MTADVSNCHKVEAVPAHSANRFVFVPVVLDMQQLYDEWLTHRHNRQTDGATLTQHTPKDKNTVMPTDNAETMVGKRTSGPGFN